MSWALLREAEADRTLGRRQLGRKVVLMYLARRADDAGVVKVGSRIIAGDTDTDHRRVRRLLDELCDMGRIDLVVRGRNGRGHAHTWRVLTMAEWQARKGGVESAFGPMRKGGVEDTEKGATSPSPEQTPTEEPLTPPVAVDGSTARGPAPVSAPSLPGLGVGEEGMPALGATPRAAGSNLRATGRNPRALTQAEEDERRRRAADERTATLRAEEEAARSPEAIAARRSMRERWVGRRAAGGSP